MVGIPLTIDFFGGSLFTSDQYLAWKVVHGYGIFLAFSNYFFGMCIDRLNLTRGQKEISSWSFLMAGFIGGVGRMVLVLLSALSEFGVYFSLGACRRELLLPRCSCRIAKSGGSTGRMRTVLAVICLTGAWIWQSRPSVAFSPTDCWKLPVRRLLRWKPLVATRCVSTCSQRRW